MSRQRFTRRDLLASTGAALAVPMIEASGAVPEFPFPANPAEALARLKEGNERFASGQTRHAHQSVEWRKHLVGTQKPFATILGCADSRVPVELVFDQGFGDLFVVRVAGNVIAPDVVGSLEYALVHLQTPLVVIVGHHGCGAVTAALQAMQGPTNEPRSIKSLVDLIEPGLPRTIPGETQEQRVNSAVEANVRWSMKQLAQSPHGKQVLESKRVQLQGAVYELATGRVRFLTD